MATDGAEANEVLDAAEAKRREITSALRESFRDNGGRFLAPDDPRFMHGWLCGRGSSGPLASPSVCAKPAVLWKSEQKPRKDHDAPAWLTATEYEDVPAVMNAKAALSGVNKTGWLDKTAAKPTMTHHALAILSRSGLIHGWVQQNHDGLPQKAGFPQEKLCEIHGAWYDPSNPVVKYCGSLKAHEAEWMEKEAERADLVLVLGTSLGGLCADQVATSCAGRALGHPADPGPPCLGACIINLQQTAEDDKMSLKLSGRSDTILAKLLREFELADQLPADPKRNAAMSTVKCALVPYDESGVRLPEGSAQPRMWLNLAPGAQVKLISRGPAKHNHQGAKQPHTIHIGSKQGQTFGGKPIPGAGSRPGHGKVVRRDDETCSLLLQIEGTQCRMGTWWLEAAARGGPAMLPLVNLAPRFEGAPDPSARSAAAAVSSSKAAAAGSSKAATGKAAAGKAATGTAAAATSRSSSGKGGNGAIAPPTASAGAGGKRKVLVPAAVAAAAKAVDETMNAYAMLA